MNMNKINIIGLCSLTILLFSACQKEIDIDMGDYDKHPVIEGYIENGQYAWVELTYNQKFFQQINLDFSTPEGLQTIKNLFITNATVTVSDGKIEDTLHFVIDSAIFQGKYVWPPVKYVGSKIKGKIGGKYDLTIKINDETYTSSTIITKPLKPDSIWVEYDPKIDSLCWIHALITDDPSERNYYNCFTKRLGKDNYFAPALLCLMSDTYFNGRQFEVPIYRGYASSLSNDTTGYSSIENTGKFNVGDTVIVKIVTMDYNSYKFWKTLKHSTITESNINGDVTGVWCGYGAYYSEPIICKKGHQ